MTFLSRLTSYSAFAVCAAIAVFLFAVPQAHAAQSITASGVTVTLTSAETVSESGYTLQVSMQDSEGGIGQLTGAYSLNTKAYDNVFFDNPVVQGDGPSTKLVGTGSNFSAGMQLSPGANTIHIWVGKTTVGTNYTYAGAFTVTYSTIKDYNIQLVSADDVTSDAYDLLVDVSNVDFANEQVHYLHNSLDINSRVRMNKLIFFATRFSSPSSLTLSPGGNAITVLVTDNDGNLRPGPDSVKLFNINYTEPPNNPVIEANPVIEVPLDVGVIEGVEPAPAEEPENRGDNEIVVDVDIEAERSFELDEDVVVPAGNENENEQAQEQNTEGQEELARIQEELERQQAELEAERQRLQEQLEMLNGMEDEEPSATGEAQEQNNNNVVEDMARDQIMDELAEVEQELERVASAQDAVDMMEENMEKDPEVISLLLGDNEEKNTQTHLIIGILVGGIALLLLIIIVLVHQRHREKLA